MRSLFRVAVSTALAVLAASPLVVASPARASTSAVITDSAVTTDSAVKSDGAVKSDSAARAGSAVTTDSAVKDDRGGVTLAIDSISPRTATATSTVVVSGTVSNGTGSPLAGLSVALNSSQAQFTARDLMDDFADGNYTPGLVADGSPFAFSVTVQPGKTANWRAEFTSAEAGMSAFGVYGLQAQLTGPSGSILATDRTLLPFWPGSSAEGAKLKVAWIWPLIDRPYTQACGWLTSAALASSLAKDGRLGGLLAAGTGNPRAQLTWAVDPALLDDAQTLAGPYQVGGPDCTGLRQEPASSAARGWLNTLRSSTAGQQVIVTPYANVDVSALVHHGLTGDLKTAYKLGQDVAEPMLSKAFSLNTAVPAGGLADQSVLTALAATEHVSSVVLNSKDMPLASGEFADDATASWATGAGTTMSVLLADNTVTDVLKGAGATSAAGQFAVEQRFLAETAMIAAEAPNDPRSLVVSPPQTWNPSQALAADLLHETTSAPWLQPVQLSSLTGAHGGQSGGTARRALPAVKVSSRELSGSYLDSVSNLDAELSVYSSMLVQPPANYRARLAKSLAATESSAWRGSRAAAVHGEELVTGLTQYLTNAERKVKIIPTGQISMAGASGQLPVTIQNNLERQSVRVRLTATVATAPGSASALTVGEQKLVTIPPGQVRLVKLSVHSAPQGPSTIYLSLTSANGTVLPWTNHTQLTINSTRYGQAILLLIAAAIGLLLVSSAFRSGRRRMATATAGTDAGSTEAGRTEPGNTEPGGDAPAHGGGEERGSPGNVMTSEQDPTEAPDDLADARRWADDA